MAPTLNLLTNDGPAMLDLNSVIAWVAGLLVVALVSYIFYRMNKVENDHASLDRDFRNHLASLPANYVAKSDYQRDIDEIKGMLKEVRGHILGRQSAL
jgi:hypothetical protein